MDLQALSPSFGEQPSAAARRTRHPGNVGAVRVGVVVRSTTADAERFQAAADRTLPATGNRSAMLGPAGHRRLLVETTTAVRNTASAAPFFPTYSTNGGADRQNVGGG
jgi:hypothetical protein